MHVPFQWRIHTKFVVFAFFHMWRVHIRKMQNLQITFAYIKNGGQKILSLFFRAFVGPILPTALRSIF